MGFLDPLGEEKPRRVHNDFDLFQEITRGALYRGGRDAENVLFGYRLGTFFMLGVFAAILFFSRI